MKKRLIKAWNNAFSVETFQDIGFHTLTMVNSTYPSTIWEKSSASYAHMLAQYSMSGLEYEGTPNNEALLLLIMTKFCWTIQGIKNQRQEKGIYYFWELREREKCFMWIIVANS